MMKHILSAALGLGALTMSAASAQQIELFDGPNYTGRSVVITGPVSDLARRGFNDAASSFRVRTGQWEICEHSDYRGDCVTVSGSDASLSRFNNRISSLRPASSRPGNPGRPGGRFGDITFYSGPNYTGRSVTLNHGEPNFDRIGFNDQAQSVRYSGNRPWRACQHANYGGSCMEIRGDVPRLSSMARQISSATPDSSAGGRGGFRPRNGIWLYDGENYGGQRVDIEYENSNFDSIRFNDRASSLSVAQGEIWEVCSDAGFRGRCTTIRSEDVPSLSRLGLNNGISSARRLDHNPGGGHGGGYYQISGGVEGVRTIFFPRPQINGTLIARCMDNGRRCDASVADAICRAAGARDAVHYERGYGNSRTVDLGTGNQCHGGQCQPITDVLCVE